MRACANLYLSAYEGRDTTRITRITYWVDQLGDMPIGDVIDDHVADALHHLASRKARFYVGKDTDGKPIFKSLPKPPSGSTCNRYAAAFSSLCKWAGSQRLLPRQWVNPCKNVEKATEPQGRLPARA